LLRRLAGQGWQPTLGTLDRLAQVLDVPVASLLSEPARASHSERGRRYRSVFLSYGKPDEPFARLLWRALVRRGVQGFFFPESAVPGKRLHRTMAEGVRKNDCVVLVCSRASLNRMGVLNEIEQSLAREAAEGGEEHLIPIVRDHALFTTWKPKRADLRAQLSSRVVVDFTGVDSAGRKFDKRLRTLLRALELPT
jgi:hypothetical protein